MTKLSPNAQSALNKVIGSHTSYRVAKENFEAELQKELDSKLESYVSDRNTSVKLADIAGVPRTQIGRAMGTTNYRTVQDILEEAAGTINTTQSADKTWSVIETSNGWELVINGLGAGAVSGSAIVAGVDGELIYVDGDPFVVPQVYRNGLAEDIIEVIS